MIVDIVERNNVDCQLETGNEQRSPNVLSTHPSTPTYSVCKLCHYITASPDFLLCSRHNYYGHERTLSLECNHVILDHLLKRQTQSHTTAWWRLEIQHKYGCNELLAKTTYGVVFLWEASLCQRNAGILHLSHKTAEPQAGQYHSAACITSCLWLIQQIMTLFFLLFWWFLLIHDLPFCVPWRYVHYMARILFTPLLPYFCIFLVLADVPIFGLPTWGMGGWDGMISKIMTSQDGCLTAELVVWWLKILTI